MNTIRWASIGCGAVCEVKSLPAMYRLPHSSVTGVYARNQDKAQDFTRRHGIGKTYRSAAELLADPEVDIVYVATPPESHLRYTVDALKAGKHVYVEKPMGLNLGECQTMNEQAVASGRKLFVAHYRRSLPYFQQVKALLTGGAIGKIISFQLLHVQPPLPGDAAPQHALPWRLQPAVSGGGYFYDLAPHGLDILSFVLDSDFKHVSGHSENRAGLYEAADTVNGSFVLESGVAGTATWIFAGAPDHHTDLLTFYGTRGQLTCSIFAFKPIQLMNEAGMASFDLPRPHHIQEPHIASIVQELNGLGVCPAPAASALTTARAMDSIMGMKK